MSRDPHVYPLAPLQRGMLFHSVAEPRPGVDFQQFVCTVSPGFDVEAFRLAWERVIDRHDILRTSFHWNELRDPVQRVHRRAEMPFELLDWSQSGGRELVERRRRWLLADRRRGFDVTSAPCMRLTIARMPEDRHLVVWSFHHLLLDGRSFFTVLSDLFAFYEGNRSGEEPALPEARPFSEYLEWFRERDHGPAREFWRRVLDGVSPTPITVARARMRELADDESPSGRYETRLSKDTSERIREVARQHDVTPNTLLMTAWSIVLSRYGGGRDVVFGATRSGRHSTVPDADSIVGMTINTLPVRARFAPDDVVARVAGEIRDLWVAMRPFEHTPLTQALEAAGARSDTPLFDSIVVAEGYDWKTALRERVGDVLDPGFEILEWTNYPMTVVADLGPEIVFALEYDRRRFDDAAPARMLGHLETVFESFADGLERPVRDLPMLRPEERRDLLFDRNATDAPFDEAACIHHLFQRQVAARPDAPAVSSGGLTVSFAELSARARRIAAELREHGVGPDAPVGLCLERGVDLAAAILGVLEAGGAYVPLDPDYPRERLRFMIEETGVRVVLTEDYLAPALPDGDVTRIYLDRERSEAASSVPPPESVRPDQAACILYTSGSTGKPKGVVLTHGSLVSHATQMVKVLGLGPDDRVPQSASTSFDLALLELFATWAAGATVVMRPDGALGSARLGPWLESEGVTVLHLPTALWHQWVNDLAREGGALPKSLRLVLVGGEKASTAAVNAWRRLGRGRVRWINIYGPTECTVNATLYEPDLTPGAPAIEDEVPIGRPIGNARVYVLDERLEPVPVGVPGEVYIGGRGVARGYLASPEATAERFLPDPFVGRAGMRMYRTGDLARWREDGHLEFVGRVDHQVKVRGYRVELGEVETALERNPAVAQAVVQPEDERAGTRRLVAYVVPVESPGPGADELRELLKRTLPDYMVPSAFVLLDELPRSPNGKVDRARLPSPEERPVARAARYAPPRNPVEETLAEVFGRVLGVPRVGIHDSFFDLGGQSLLALGILDELGRAGLSLTVEDLFQHPTVAELAPRVSIQKMGAGRWSSLVALRRTGERRPLFVLHTTPGDLLGYMDLVRALGPSQPCFGFQSLGLYDLAQAHIHIEEMASHYLELLTRHQPEGPYHLVGWCYGGVVAFEMAQQLVRAGRRVGLLALIDTPAPRAGLDQVGWWADRARAVARIDKRHLARYVADKVRDRIRGKAERHAEALEVEVSTGPLANRGRISEVNLRAVRMYRPRFYSGKLTLIRRAEPLRATISDPWLGWRTLVGQMEIQTVDAPTHHSILRAPHVDELAALIRDRM